MSDLNLAVIGNCTYAALIDRTARMVWACLPRFDSDPVFCRLLDGADGTGNDPEIGMFEVGLEGFVRSEQEYLSNTAVLVTRLYAKDGSGIEIIDFAPRFKNLARVFRPLMMVRQVRPLVGSPRIQIRLRPAYGYGGGRPERTRGSNHIRYVAPGISLRCTTDGPVAFILDEVSFILDDPLTMFVGADEPLTSPVAETGREFFERTCEYWREWARYLSIPFEWQRAVIRAAITLKICSYEESGAIVAAITTSIPEAPGSGRNWDYRYCWLRDGYFVVQALNRLGATKTMEGYIRFITNVVAGSDDGNLQPVYGIALDRNLSEDVVDSLAGYRGMGPVRKGNQAFEHVQNDIYGSVILAATQVFFDERLMHPGTVALFERLESLGRKAVSLFDKPDAGLWEFRTRKEVHTFSAVMCWAGCDRLAKIAARLGRDDRASHWRAKADEIRAVILERAFHERLNSFVSSFGGGDLDGSLLLLLELGFVAADDPRFAGTVEAVGHLLKRGRYLLRYARRDDIGEPETAFNICTFWYIDALAMLGRRDEAREMFENMLACRNHVGLLSEDIDPETGELWGNFPQSYSLVGLINSAMRLSKSWRDAF